MCFFFVLPLLGAPRAAHRVVIPAVHYTPHHISYHTITETVSTESCWGEYATLGNHMWSPMCGPCVDVTEYVQVVLVVDEVLVDMLHRQQQVGTAVLNTHRTRNTESDVSTIGGW